MFIQGITMESNYGGITMPQNGLTGVPVVKIISIRIIYNFFTYIYTHTKGKEPIYKNFTKIGIVQKITRNNITEKGRKKSNHAVLSNWNSYFWMSKRRT